MNRIYVDRPRNLVVLSLTGYADRDSVVAFCAEIRIAVRSLGSAAGSHDIICDLSRVPVGPAETIAALADILSTPDYRDIRARRLALHTPSALSRLQLERLKVRPGIEIFDSSIAAYRWLNEGRTMAAA